MSNLEDVYFKPREAAEFLRTSTSTLAKRRLNGDGPKYCRIGRAIRYLKSDLDEYMARSNVASVMPASAQAPQVPTEWDREVDVVVIGSGATGLPAAIIAREAGSTVILLEAEKDIGGHAITSGGNVPLGGGTSVQRKNGIEDSPDLLFRDLTDWSVVEPNGFPDYRYNDREIIRAFADNSAPTFEWLVAHGVVSSTRRLTASEGTPSETRCRGKCTAR